MKAAAQQKKDEFHELANDSEPGVPGAADPERTTTVQERVKQRRVAR